jgi:alpha-tubulin suppressor-like RCC1 family protein
VVVKVDATYGAVHAALAFTAGGDLWAWGANQVGQLGDGTSAGKNTPVRIYQSMVRQAAAGRSHSLVVLNDGTVRATGANGGGQLGDGTTTGRYTPIQVPKATNPSVALSSSPRGCAAPTH